MSAITSNLQPTNRIGICIERTTLCTRASPIKSNGKCARNAKKKQKQKTTEWDLHTTRASPLKWTENNKIKYFTYK